MLRYGKCIAVIVSFLICTFSASLLSAPLLFDQSVPTVDLHKEFENGKASLAGECEPYFQRASNTYA